MNNTERYPTLTRAIRLLADDNDLRLLAANQWVWPDADEGADLPSLEAQVSALTDDEFYLAVCGGETGDDHEFIDHNAYCESRGLQNFDWFLNEIFEGKFRNNFCRRTR